MATRKNHSDIDIFMESNLYVPTRTISMVGEIDEDLSKQMIKNLHILDNLNNEEITIIINSLGGDIFEGMSIFDSIKGCKSSVLIKICGSCMSMASIVSLAGDKIVATEHSKIMLHYGTVGFEGHPKIVKNWIKDSEQFDQWMKTQYLNKLKTKYPDFTEKNLDKWLDFDKILTADQALNLGLIDEVI